MKSKYELTERCVNLRDDAVNEKLMAKFICAQWYYWFRMGELSMLEGDYEFDNINVTAAGISSVIRNAKPYILAGELIVGHNFGDGLYQGLTWNKENDIKLFRSNGFTDSQIDAYYTESKPPYKHKTAEYNFTQQEIDLMAEQTAINSAGHVSITCNHSVIDYEKVIKLGFEGILDELSNYGDGNFYKALRTVCEAGCVFGDKYADEAESLKNNTGYNTADLDMIITVCRQVPRKPARSFIEAVQSLFFAHLINTFEDNINANSLGRLDQILYPYYTADIESGKLTRQEAFEIICCLWMKLYRDYDVQQSCVGGRSADGSSDVNELSYMMLDATEKLNFIRCISVRFDENTDKQFVQRALEVVGNVGKGVPFFFNDSVMIPALVRKGIEYEDAVKYAAIGCVETLIPGKTNPHAVNSRGNILKAIEYALNNGKSMIAPERIPGITTGDPSEFTTYDKLKEAVFKQMNHIIESTIKMAVMFMETSEYNFPKPVKSLLTEGCMESGLDFNARGAKYDYYQLMLIGIPNLADSLAALKTLVYEKKLYTLDEILYQLQNDFPDETVRLDLINKAPKYGNDISEVDNIAFEIMDYACDRIDELSEECGYSFHAQPFTFLWMIPHGEMTGATPDGRRKGEIIAYSMSPMQGRDMEGLTALLNSMANLPTEKAAGTTSAIVEVDPKLFEESNIGYLTDMLYTAAAKGLCNVQFNTVNADTLIDAQNNPWKHRNLAVRVSGFSQKFNLLDRKLQDHIIARTKHASL